MEKIQYKIKLSELTYEFLASIGLRDAHMHTDCEDGLRCIPNTFHTERAKEELSAKYGDVDLVITPSAVWYERIVIDDEKWRADHEAFCKEKAAWCKKYGSE
jgi:hypothetical protein